MHEFGLGRLALFTCSPLVCSFCVHFLYSYQRRFIIRPCIYSKILKLRLSLKKTLKHDLVKIICSLFCSQGKTIVFSQSNSMFLMIKLIGQSKTFHLHLRHSGAMSSLEKGTSTHHSSIVLTFDVLQHDNKLSIFTTNGSKIVLKIYIQVQVKTFSTSID